MTNVAFFGTSDKSQPILDALNDNFDLTLCITKTDVKVGRKQKLKESGVKKWAKENKVDYICIDSIKKSQKEIISKLKKYEIEIGIVADFRFMIPKEIIEVPKYGLVNIHFSLLPKLRGASPVQHAILKGLEKTGITYYLMDEGMDTGDIIYQIPYELDGTETTDVLYKKLFNLAAENLPKVVKGYIKGELEPKEQDDSKATYCRSETKPETTFIYKDDARIDWNKEPLAIERQIRAYYPWPVAWTTLGELENNPKLVTQIKLKDSAYPKYRVKIFDADKVDGELKINKLQVEGKSKIDWMSFVNGYAVRK